MDCLNLYPHNPQSPGAKARGVLLSTPGISDPTPLAAAALPSPARYYYRFLDILYVIAENNRLYRIASNYVATDLGDASPGDVGDETDDRPVFADNGEVMCIQWPNGKGYFLDPDDDSLTEIVDAVYAEYQDEPGGVRSATSGDGYFFLNTYTTIFRSSSVVEPDKGTSFPALAFASGEYKPDRTVCVRFAKGELWVIGERTIEPWGNIGAGEFPYARIDGGVIEKGTPFQYSFLEVDNTFYFVGGGENEEPAVWRVGGGGASRVSTGAIDNLINAAPLAGFVNFTPFAAWTYAKDGHVFYGFNVSSQNVGLAYDVTASAMQGRPVWHRRCHSVSTDQIDPTPDYFDMETPRGNYNTDRPWTCYSMAQCYSKTWIGGYGGGKLYYLDSDSTTLVSSNGSANVVPRRFSGQYLVNQGGPLFISEVRLRCAAGIGIDGNWQSSPYDTNPQVRLRYSKDSGQTWIDAGWRPMGKSGIYDEPMPRWTRLGRCPESIVFEFACDTRAQVAFYEILVGIEEGLS